jgi:beta-glucanase (GH16 family)
MVEYDYRSREKNTKGKFMKAFKFFTLTLLAFVSYRGAAGEWIEEFNEKSLDESKWCDWVWSFQGRRAGFLFARDNVAVSNGCLNLTARLMREDEKTVENLRRGFTTYATSLVRSREKFSYGYFECRAKTMNSKVCNAFWLYDPLSDKPEKKFRIGDYSEEIDIFEIFGSLKDWYGTVHCLKTPYLEGIVYAGVEKLPNKSKKIALDFDPSADFHVYGFLWSEKELVWYIDGREVFRRENDRFHRPLHVTFDCEIMYSWVGEPDKGGLPQVFSIDWFKYRPLTENSKDL